MANNNFRPLRAYLKSKSKSAKRRYATAGFGAPKKNLSTIHQKAIAGGFPPTPQYNLVYRGGKTIRNLSFYNFYVGGSGAWAKSDIQNINSALNEAMNDAGLNNVVRQYFGNKTITSVFKGSTVLAGPAPAKFTEGNVHTLLSQLYAGGQLKKFDLANTVFNFFLPKNTILTDDKNPAARKTKKDIPFEDEDSSLDGLGGYHGSLHADASTTLYYAVGVYSAKLSNGRDNGIITFDQPWKNIVATFYHELIEARTDADVDDAIRTGKDSYCGWVNKNGEEIGDIPMREAGARLKLVMKEIALANGKGKVPVQLQYSNAVNGPEGPIASLH
jgi:hypothetical protein